jgi:hypothetical protein
VETTDTVYKIWTDGLPGTEYFLLENRQKIGFDTSIKGEGIVIYHVDETVYGNDNQRCGAGSPHYELAVEQADGECDLEYDRNSGDSGDPWPGSGGSENPNYAFDDTSTPNTRDYSNNPTNVSVYDINMSGDDGYVSISVGAADTEAPDVTVLDPNGGETWEIDSFFDIMWDATDNVGVTSIDILLSSDGGATYPHTIAAGEANDGVYTWLVDVSSTTEARVKVIAYDAAGNEGEDVSGADFELYDPLSGVITEIEKPGRLMIAEATPNPFSKHTSIRFGIPVGGRVSLEAYDVAGRQVALVAEGEYPAGYHSVEWKDADQVAGTGLYFLRLRSHDEAVTYKVVISR